jgi:hypothetical protein
MVMGWRVGHLCVTFNVLNESAHPLRQTSIKTPRDLTRLADPHL